MSSDREILLKALRDKKIELSTSGVEKSLDFLFELGLITNQDIRRVKLKRINDNML